MSKKTLRNLIAASIALFVTVAGLVLILIVIEAQGKQLSTYISALNEEQSQEQAFYKLQRVSSESQADREKLQNYFLTKESDTIPLLIKIETMAEQIGVAFAEEEDYNLQVVTDKKTGAKWVEMRVVVSGPEANVRRFIDALEHLPYLSKVTDLKFGVLSSQLWEAQITLRVSMQTYAQ